MFYPRSFARTTLKIASQKFTLSALIKTHFARALRAVFVRRAKNARNAVIISVFLKCAKIAAIPVIASVANATRGNPLRDKVAFLGAKNADSKIKAQNEAKRFAPKEKIRASKSSFFRGQPR